MSFLTPINFVACLVVESGSVFRLGSDSASLGSLLFSNLPFLQSLDSMGSEENVPSL